MSKRKLKNPYSAKIPFKSDGSVPWEQPKETETHWTAGWDYKRHQKVAAGPIDWRENKPFQAALKFNRIVNRRSSVRFVLENIGTGATYYVSEERFNEMMETTTWIFGVCIGEWVFHSYRGYISIVPASKVGEFQNR